MGVVLNPYARYGVVMIYGDLKYLLGYEWKGLVRHEQTLRSPRFCSFLIPWSTGFWFVHC